MEQYRLILFHFTFAIELSNCFTDTDCSICAKQSAYHRYNTNRLCYLANTLPNRPIDLLNPYLVEDSRVSVSPRQTMILSVLTRHNAIASFPRNYEIRTAYACLCAQVLLHVNESEWAVLLAACAVTIKSSNREMKRKVASRSLCGWLLIKHDKSGRDKRKQRWNTWRSRYQTRIIGKLHFTFCNDANKSLGPCMEIVNASGIRNF